MGLLGGLIGAGASLIGGALNRKEQRKTNEANRPVNQVREWEEAGINPLFGISSGGYVPHQASSIGDSFATAGGVFSQHLAQSKEQELRETQLELENDKLKKELDGLVKPVEPSHMDKYGGILPLPSNGETNAQSGPADLDTPDSIAGVHGDNVDVDPRVSVTPTHDLGYQGYTNPRVLDAEMSETRYGDVAQEFAGIKNIYKDNAYHSRLTRLSEQYGKEVADEVHKRFAAPPYAKPLGDIITEVTAGKPRKQKPKHKPSGSSVRKKNRN